MFKLIVIAFIISSVVAVAHEEKPGEQFHHQLGASSSINFGFDINYGVSYHYIFSDKYRIILTGAYYKVQGGSIDDDRDTYMSVSIEGQKTFYKTNSTRIYGFLDLGYYPSIHETFYDGDGHSKHNYKLYTGGIGAGIELLAIGRIAVSVGAGVFYSFEEHFGTNNFTWILIPNSYSSKVGFGLGGNIGIGYQF